MHARKREQPAIRSENSAGKLVELEHRHPDVRLGQLLRTKQDPRPQRKGRRRRRRGGIAGMLIDVERGVVVRGFQRPAVGQIVGFLHLGQKPRAAGERLRAVGEIDGRRRRDPRGIQAGHTGAGIHRTHGSHFRRDHGRAPRRQRLPGHGDSRIAGGQRVLQHHGIAAGLAQNERNRVTARTRNEGFGQPRGSGGIKPDERRALTCREGLQQFQRSRHIRTRLTRKIHLERRQRTPTDRQRQRQCLAVQLGDRHGFDLSKGLRRERQHHPLPRRFDDRRIQ